MGPPEGRDERPVLLHVEDGIAFIALNRPRAYNAIDLELARLLSDLAVEIAADPQIKVVVIRGEGAAFCGGGDVRHFASNLDDIGSYIRTLLAAYHGFLIRLHTMPKIVVASVHGSAAGAGLSLVSMCDLCIVADNAVFTPAYAKIGVSPDGGGTYGLARAVGERRALQIYLAEDSFSARQALDWGLATKLVPAAELAEATKDYARRLARNTDGAIAGTKRLLRDGATASVEAQLEDEMETLIGCMASETFVSAVRKFGARP